MGGYPADRPDVTLKDYINILIPLGVLFVICPLVAISAKVGYDHRWYFQYRLARYKIAKERRGQGKRKHKVRELVMVYNCLSNFWLLRTPVRLRTTLSSPTTRWTAI